MPRLRSLSTPEECVAELTFGCAHRWIQLCGLRVGFYGYSPSRWGRHFRGLRSASLNYADDPLPITNNAFKIMDHLVKLV